MPAHTTRVQFHSRPPLRGAHLVRVWSRRSTTSVCTREKGSRRCTPLRVRPQTHNEDGGGMRRCVTGRRRKPRTHSAWLFPVGGSLLAWWFRSQPNFKFAGKSAGGGSCGGGVVSELTPPCRSSTSTASCSAATAGCVGHTPQKPRPALCCFAGDDTTTRRRAASSIVGPTTHSR